jgi:hypothetical protein
VWESSQGGGVAEQEPVKMSEELSDNQISLLCDIGDNARPLAHVHDARKSDLETLIRQGYAELVQDQLASPYRLTAKGIAFLSERGAGLNEA